MISERRRLVRAAITPIMKTAPEPQAVTSLAVFRVKDFELNLRWNRAMHPYGLFACEVFLFCKIYVHIKEISL